MGLSQTDSHAVAHDDVDEEEQNGCRHTNHSSDVALANVTLILGCHLQFLLVYSRLFTGFGDARKSNGRVKSFGDTYTHGTGCVDTTGLLIDFILL